MDPVVKKCTFGLDCMGGSITKTTFYTLESKTTSIFFGVISQVFFEESTALSRVRKRFYTLKDL